MKNWKEVLGCFGMLFVIIFAIWAFQFPAVSSTEVPITAEVLFLTLDNDGMLMAHTTSGIFRVNRTEFTSGSAKVTGTSYIYKQTAKGLFGKDDEWKSIGRFGALRVNNIDHIRKLLLVNP